MNIVTSLSKPVLEVLEQRSIPRSTTVNLKVTFDVGFKIPEGREIPVGRDSFHALYGIRVEVNGYKDPDHQTRDNHTHLFNFKRMTSRFVSGGIFTGSPIGGGFQEVPTRDFLLSRNIPRTTPGEPHITIDGQGEPYTANYRDQTAISQDVSFDLLDVNKRRKLPWRVPAELDILFVRLFVIDLLTGHVVKENRSNNFQGKFEIGKYERSSK